MKNRRNSERIDNNDYAKANKIIKDAFNKSEAAKKIAKKIDKK